MMAQSQFKSTVFLKYNQERVGERLIECANEYTPTSYFSCRG